MIVASVCIRDKIWLHSNTSPSTVQQFQFLLLFWNFFLIFNNSQLQKYFLLCTFSLDSYPCSTELVASNLQALESCFTLEYFGRRGGNDAVITSTRCIRKSQANPIQVEDTLSTIECEERKYYFLLALDSDWWKQQDKWKRKLLIVDE